MPPTTIPPKISPPPRRLDWPQVALVGLVIAGVLGTLAIVLTLTPQHLLERLVAINWHAAVLGAVSLAIAVYGMLRRAGLWKHGPELATPALAERPPELDDEDPTPAISGTARARRDRPPGGFVLPSLLIAIATVGALALAASLLSGCGASAVDTHYQVLGAIASVYDVATDGAETTLTAQAQACDDEPCVEQLRSSWAPIRAGQAAVLLALQGYAAALRLWHDAGDLPALARAAVRSLAALGTAWQTWASAAGAVGWSLPSIPPEALALVGGGAP